jgi:hypothetical protein
VGIYFHPTSALNLQERADPFLWVDRSTIFVYFIGSMYLPTSELVETDIFSCYYSLILLIRWFVFTVLTHFFRFNLQTVLLSG